MSEVVAVTMDSLITRTLKAGRAGRGDAEDPSGKKQRREEHKADMAIPPLVTVSLAPASNVLELENENCKRVFETPHPGDPQHELEGKTKSRRVESTNNDADTCSTDAQAITPLAYKKGLAVRSHHTPPQHCG